MLPRRFSAMVLGVLSPLAFAETINHDLDDVTQWQPIDADVTEYKELFANPEKIMGKPDFVKVASLSPNDPDYRLSRSVGQFLLPKRGAFCSGSLVGPNLFLTNHHCVDNDKGGFVDVDEIVIAMEHLDDGNFGPRGSGSGVTRIVRAEKSLDYALLELSKPLGETYGWLPLERDANAIERQRSVKIIQHPRGRSKEIVTNNTQTLNCPSGIPSYMYCYLADTEGGSSGSPVFAVDGTTIIALHRAGVEGQANIGTQIHYVAQRISSYLPVTGGSPAKPAAASAQPATQQPAKQTPDRRTRQAPAAAQPASPPPVAAPAKAPVQAPAKAPTQAPTPAPAQAPAPEPPAKKKKDDDDGDWKPIT